MQIRKLLEEKAILIINTIQSIAELEFILKSQDLTLRDSLWYMQLNQVHKVLDTRIMDRLMREYWLGDYESGGTMFETC